MTIVYYKIPVFAGRNGRIKAGYISLDISNGFAKVDADDPDQVALVKAHSGELDKDIPAKKSSSKKAVK